MAVSDLLRGLPHEVWARVFSFLPAAHRVPAFCALRRANVVAIDMHAFHTMSLFMSEAALAERRAAVHAAATAPWPSLAAVVAPGLVEQLCDMGFARDAAIRALVRYGGDDLPRAVDWLTTHT